MNGARDLYVTEILHKAYIDVNEKGTEAAAATAILVGLTSVMEPNVFDVNRPSLFFIRDESSGAILFLGRLVKPPGDGATIGEFGEGDISFGDYDSGSVNSVLVSGLFSVACLIMTTVCIN